MPDRPSDPNDPENVEENSWPEENQDVVPDRPPVALISVTRALSRRWQDLDDTTPSPPKTSDDSPDEDGHYLSELSNLAEIDDALGQDVDPELLADLARVLTSRLRMRLRASRQAHGQLIRELVTLAESFGRADLVIAPWLSQQKKTEEELLDVQQTF